jgi:hypothetical protein
MNAKQKLAAAYIGYVELEQRRTCSVEEAAHFADCSPDIIEAFLREQNASPANTINPLERMGIPTHEFTATAAVLEKLGYAVASVDKGARAAEFTRSGSASFIVKADGSWSSPDMASKEVSSGATAFQLQVLMGVM